MRGQMNEGMTSNDLSLEQSFLHDHRPSYPLGTLLVPGKLSDIGHLGGRQRNAVLSIRSWSAIRVREVKRSDREGKGQEFRETAERE